MAWVKLESRYPRHPKMVEVGALGIALDVCGICYAREHGTDGFIPDSALPLIGPVPNATKVARALAEVGRWIRDDARRGWWIHDFLEYQPTDEAEGEVAVRRREKATKAAEARWDRARARSNAPSNAQALLDGCSTDATEQCSSNAPLPSPPLELQVGGSLTGVAAGRSDPQAAPLGLRAALAAARPRSGAAL